MSQTYALVIIRLKMDSYPIHQAVKVRDLYSLAKHLSLKAFDVNALDGDGFPALLIAC